MLLKIRHHRKAQSLVEFALGGILLMMLLAAAVDLGRAYYTYIVVENMAGEGAQYLSLKPDADIVINNQLPLDATFQGRARNVAVKSQSMVISPTWVNPAADVVLEPPVAQSNRCAGKQFNVVVTYHLNDLFFPAFLGFQNLPISAKSSSAFYRDSASANAVCPTPTPVN
jgi:Flp pilus assembly protein TadG